MVIDVTSGLGRFFKIPTPAERLAGLKVRSDVAAAAVKMAASRRSDLTAQMIGDALPESEVAVAMIEGRRDKARGVLLLTTRRVLFVSYDRAGFQAEIALSGLSRAAVVPRGMHLSVGPIAVDQTLGRSADIFAEAVLRQLDPEPAEGTKDPMQALAEIRALHDAGVMSDEEFAAEKARLLDQL